METQTEFKRKNRLGLNILEIPEKGSAVFEIQSEKPEIFTSRNYPDGIKYLLVADLRTGETGQIWLSGQLNYQFEELSHSKSLAGLKVEILHKGKKSMKDSDGETINVNQYDIFELE